MVYHTELEHERDMVPKPQLPARARCLFYLVRIHLQYMFNLVTDILA